VRYAIAAFIAALTLAACGGSEETWAGLTEEEAKETIEEIVTDPEASIEAEIGVNMDAGWYVDTRVIKPVAIGSAGEEAWAAKFPLFYQDPDPDDLSGPSIVPPLGDHACVIVREPPFGDGYVYSADYC
jgi:hypothetical protein